MENVHRVCVSGVKWRMSTVCVFQGLNGECPLCVCVSGVK